MNAKDLTDLLIDAGIDAHEAELRAESYVEDNRMNDKLQKSLDVLEDVVEAQKEAEFQAQERLSKAFDDGEQSLASALAPALDSMLEETRAQNMALCKSFAGVLEILKGMKDEIKALKGSKSVDHEPMAKSIDYIPSPYDNVASTDARNDLFKALSSTKVENATQASELLQMATLLESGASPADIQARFNQGVK